MKKTILLCFMVPLFAHAWVYNEVKRLPKGCYAELSPKKQNTVYPLCMGDADNAANRPTKTPMQLYNKFGYSICSSYEKLRAKNLDSYIELLRFGSEQQKAYLRSCDSIYAWYLVGKKHNYNKNTDNFEFYDLYIHELMNFTSVRSSELYTKLDTAPSAKLKPESSGGYLIPLIAEPSINKDKRYAVRKLDVESSHQKQSLTDDNAYIKFAVLSSPDKIDQLKKELADQGVDTIVQTIQTENGTLYRLIAGPFSRKDAQNKLQQLSVNGYSGVVTDK